MKKILMLCIGLLSIPYALSQEISVEDAVRYSSDEIQGTARFRAMSGAFGALGGDMSSVNINPAGSVIFNASHTSFSLGVFDTNNNVNYFNSTVKSSQSSINLNQFGAAFVFRNTNINSPWKKFALSMAYDRSADYDDDWVSSGINPNTSIAEYFNTYANGLRLDQISALPGETISQAYAAIGSISGFRNQQAFLGYEGFIIDPENDTDENTAYTTNINGSNFNQRYIYSSRGYNGKAAFNFATSYKDRFYIGLNLNAHFINYDRSTLLNERNSNLASSVQEVNFENKLSTFGSGFSFQLGTIAKITEQFRVGLAYNSPTWLRISEENSQVLATTRIENGSAITQVLSPNVINIYEEYQLRTPGKFTGSLAYIFGQKALLSFDYSIKDYSNAEFRPTTDILFSEINSQINNSLSSSAYSYRLGGEYRLNQVSFRGGYRFEQSPYNNGIVVGDLKGYSLGLGYNFGNINLDFAFSQSERDVNYQLYSVGLTDAANLQSRFRDFILTLAFSL
jgi:long-subunit fatty acid transport protein